MNFDFIFSEPMTSLSLSLSLSFSLSLSLSLYLSLSLISLPPSTLSLRSILISTFYLHLSTRSIFANPLPAEIFKVILRSTWYVHLNTLDLIIPIIFVKYGVEHEL